MKYSKQISQSLKTACTFLDHEKDRKIIKDVELVCQKLVDSSFQIAVLAPFNFGKSTLLNALLGEEIMPAKMTRTTGIAIKIKYGEKLSIVITFKSGETIKSSNTEVLKRFTVLSKQGQKRDDVVSVMVFYPHIFLKQGVELLDLPGTNDREEQDMLVRDQLLQADLIVQILNAKQPFTLGEQENLRQWLVDRGIRNVVFVINWMNQLETKNERREVYNEVKSTTNAFKSDLPEGVKNLYRVDALPALKAKQKQNILDLFKSGMTEFEAILYIIASFQKQRTDITRFPRIITASTQVKQSLQEKSQSIAAELKTVEDAITVEIKKRKKREKLLREEFKEITKSLRNWLSLQTLTTCYQLCLAEALENSNFYDWQDSELKPKLASYVKPIEKWVSQAYIELQHQNHLDSLRVSFPSQPKISFPQRQEVGFGQRFGDIFSGGSNRKKLDEDYQRKRWVAYKKSAYSYLSDFSKDALKSLNQYENQVEPLIRFTIPRESSEIISRRNYLESLNTTIGELEKIEGIEFDDCKSKVYGKFSALKKIWSFGKIQLAIVKYYAKKK